MNLLDAFAGAPAGPVPVRVDFTLRMPMVVPSTDKPLDAVMSWAAVRQAEFNDHEDPYSVQHDLGLARHTADSIDGPQWCLCASNLEFEWDGSQQSLHYIKRSSLTPYVEAWMDGLLAKKPVFDGSRGATKAGSFMVTLRWVKRITGYALVEDPARFCEVLAWVTHIGKLHHKDYGATSGISLAIDDAAKERWMQRVLPIASPYAKGSRAIGALRAPYWKRENHQAVCIPQ